MNLKSFLKQELFLEGAPSVPSGKKYLLLLDIDDTLLKANNIFIHRKLPTDKSVVKLTPDQYAKEKVTPETKKYYSYEEFRDPKIVEKSIISGTPIWRNLRIMDDHIKAGWEIGILTARGLESVIDSALRKWLMFRNSDSVLVSLKNDLKRNLINAVNDEVKIYKGKTDYEKKVNVIKDYLKKGFDKIKFLDDDMKNIKAVREMAKKENLTDKIQAVVAQT